MARDGTNRGGARPGAGRPRKALAEKIAEGKTAEVMIQPAEIESAETPPAPYILYRTFATFEFSSCFLFIFYYITRALFVKFYCTGSMFSTLTKYQHTQLLRRFYF